MGRQPRHKGLINARELQKRENNRGRGYTRWPSSLSSWRRQVLCSNVAEVGSCSFRFASNNSNPLSTMLHRGNGSTRKMHARDPFGNDLCSTFRVKEANSQPESLLNTRMLRKGVEVEAALDTLSFRPGNNTPQEQRSLPFSFSGRQHKFFVVKNQNRQRLNFGGMDDASLHRIWYHTHAFSVLVMCERRDGGSETCTTFTIPPSSVSPFP